MSSRAWLALCAIVFSMGGFTGWICRVRSTDDMYIRKQANMYAATEQYYNMMLAQTIKDNERIYRNGRK